MVEERERESVWREIEREREPFLYNLPNIWMSCDEIRMLFLISQPRTASERGGGG